MAVEIIPANIRDLLEKTLKQRLENFHVTVHENNEKGAGYLGRMVFVSLKSTSTKDETHLVIKQALTSSGPKSLQFSSTVFHNELYFYEELWPHLDEYQVENIGGQGIFRGIPKCWETVRESGGEKLVLENLNLQNFRVPDKKQCLDKDQLEFAFLTYGKFHGTSFAYRMRCPEKFEELCEPLKNIFEYFLTGTDWFKKSMRRSFKFVWDNLDEGCHVIVRDKLRKYVENGPEFYASIMNYTGKYSVLLHGDCWSNNIMFKYDVCGKIIDVKMIDFQMIRKGSPIFDLSYCFYSGASGTALKNLPHFQRIYHQSFSQTLAKFGCDPNNAYPFETFKEEWKTQAKFGFMMGVICWEQKLRFTAGVRDLNKIMDGDMAEMRKPRVFDSEKFKEVTTDVVLHMHENDFL